jgi:hypothetical protein
MQPSNLTSRRRQFDRALPLIFLPFLALACLVGGLGGTEIPLPTVLVVPTALPPSATALPATPKAAPTQLPTDTPSPTAEPTSTPTPPPVFGIQLDQLDAPNGLAQAHAAGAYWLRRASVDWPAIEAVEGARDWTAMSNMEQELLGAAEQGGQIILVVHGEPDWAQALAGSNCGPIRPDKLDAFGDFVYELVSRYSVPPYNVKYWEMWNEPDVAPNIAPPEGYLGCWGDPSDPDGYGGGKYADMLAAAYPRVKEADPEAQVVAGALLLDCDPNNPPKGKDCSPSNFLNGILDHHGLDDGGDYFDGLSFHAYDYASTQGVGQYVNPNWDSQWNTTGPVLYAKAQFVKGVLASHGVTGKFLMNTEVAVIAGDLQCFGCDFPDETRQATKTNYVAQANAVALSEGLVANVWYSLFGWRGSALMDKDLNALPAYTAYTFSAAELGQAVFVREVTELDGVRGYEFQRDGSRVWIVWSRDGETHHVTLPEAPQNLFDVLGQPQTPSAELDVGPSTLYVEWAS